MRSSAIKRPYLIKRFLSGKDRILIAVVLAAAAVAALAMLSVQGGPGETVRITAGREEYGVYGLHEDQEILIEQPSGYNRVVIRDSTVYMESADCPDKYCVEHRPISKGGETIVCLPHKIVVEVEGRTDGQQPDAVVW